MDDSRALLYKVHTTPQSGAFYPGEPDVFCHGLDGYEAEIWYELPTPADPPDPADLLLKHDGAWYCCGVPRHLLEGALLWAYFQRAG